MTRWLTPAVLCTAPSMHVFPSPSPSPSPPPKQLIDTPSLVAGPPCLDAGARPPARALHNSRPCTLAFTRGRRDTSRAERIRHHLAPLTGPCSLTRGHAEC
ncbi:hypothetical protein CALCODRAFT_504248 [Calocera cornea HHB12733]|uniref:Uncharacterized protein n=1 Tax=Calocera cornea HHB12733 TaxID=1353952 RepID=A0A165CII0_9BASI|nr:hypothetical protein CALCODRAFT_504248 [Calocera cornea HHB12733]